MVARLPQCESFLIEISTFPSEKIAQARLGWFSRRARIRTRAQPNPPLHVRYIMCTEKPGLSCSRSVPYVYVDSYTPPRFTTPAALARKPENCESDCEQDPYKMKSSVPRQSLNHRNTHEHAEDFGVFPKFLQSLYPDRENAAALPNFITPQVVAKLPGGLDLHSLSVDPLPQSVLPSTDSLTGRLLSSSKGLQSVQPC